MLSQNSCNTKNWTQLCKTHRNHNKVFNFSFNLINWTLSDVKFKKIDTKIKADVDRLHIPRSEDVRGIIQLELSLKTTTVSLQKYFDAKELD